MTDLDKMKTLLTDFGVEFKEHQRGGAGSTLTLEVGMQRVRGYAGFVTEFNFNLNGTFNHVAVGE